MKPGATTADLLQLFDEAMGALADGAADLAERVRRVMERVNDPASTPPPLPVGTDR